MSVTTHAVLPFFTVPDMRYVSGVVLVAIAVALETPHPRFDCVAAPSGSIIPTKHVAQLGAVTRNFTSAAVGAVT